MIQPNPTHPADAQTSDHPRPTVFLSYASEDRAAVQRIRDALPRYGLEVWYDESDLLGGDAWDQKIRLQIRDCDFFMPVISAHTEARREGYFRREWRLAAERTLDMADDSVFLVPVVIDDTGETHARVPDKFRAVQWVRLPDGQPNAALEGLCRRLVSGEAQALPAGRSAPAPRAGRRPQSPGIDFPAFPREEPGQRTRFWLQVLGWALKSAWVAFRRLPKWLRIVVYFWLAVVFLQVTFGSSHHDTHPLSSAQTYNLAQLVRLAQSLKNDPQSAYTAKETRQLAQISKPAPATAAASSARASLLAIPFTAPPGDASDRRFAATVFERVCDRLRLARHGHLALSRTAPPSVDSAAAVELGRARHSSYVLYGAVHGHALKATLTVRILSSAGSLLWSKSYPVAGADPARIASEVASAAPGVERD